MEALAQAAAQSSQGYQFTVPFSSLDEFSSGHSEKCDENPLMSFACIAEAASLDSEESISNEYGTQRRTKRQAFDAFGDEAALDPDLGSPPKMLKTSNLSLDASGAFTAFVRSEKSTPQVESEVQSKVALKHVEIASEIYKQRMLKVLEANENGQTADSPIFNPDPTYLARALKSQISASDALDEPLQHEGPSIPEAMQDHYESRASSSVTPSDVSPPLSAYGSQVSVSASCSVHPQGMYPPPAPQRYQPTYGPSTGPHPMYYQHAPPSGIPPMNYVPMEARTMSSQYPSQMYPSQAMPARYSYGQPSSIYRGYPPAGYSAGPPQVQRSHIPYGEGDFRQRPPVAPMQYQAPPTQRHMYGPPANQGYYASQPVPYQAPPPAAAQRYPLQGYTSNQVQYQQRR
eukprot:TRINITY_DN3975_c0_g1_i1.p1 TRINITY_DN3975_c0_g1~~TRINITY_DN3975_c0_g1_i1.p1  ORF type:complete len:402 (+),score=73.27 TRINITY_DN3975_c0_g1_i1:372-1577(+)